MVVSSRRGVVESGHATGDCGQVRSAIDARMAEPCWRRRPGCSSCSRCCRDAATGRGPSSPSDSRWGRGPSAGTSSACGASATPSRRGPACPAATGPARAHRCRRCCSTSRRPLPSPDRRFVPREPPAEDLAAYVARRVSATRDRYQARVILRVPLAEVAPRVPPAAGTLEAIDARSCLLLTGADWLGGLAVYIADIGVDFEIVEPPELVELVRRLADRFARAAR